MIAARGLCRRFDGRPAVEDVTFSVPEGALCVLLGPNGAGKTTTVRMLLGLLEPDSGSAEVAGVRLPASPQQSAALRARAGLLTEAPGFYDRMSGRENLLLFGVLYRLGGADLAARVERWLRLLELWEARDLPFGAYSKGMKQRLAIIRAVLHEPAVVFLDEPTAGLDPAAARVVRDLIRRLRAEGRTILLCTHNLAEAQELADLVGILQCRLVAFAPPGALGESGPERVEVRVTGNAAGVAAALGPVDGVESLHPDGDRLRAVLRDPLRGTAGLVAALVRIGAEVLEVRPLRPSLEEIYLRAVGAGQE